VEGKLEIPSAEPSLASAMEKLLLASQRLLSDRIDLALLDLRELASRSVRALSFAVAGAGLLLGGWFSLVAALVIAADRWMPISLGVALAAFVNIALGVAGLSSAARAMSKLPVAAREAASSADGSR